MCPCHNTAPSLSSELARHSTIKKAGRLSKEINESSGLIALDSSTFLTHNDGGGKAELYKVNANGKMLETYKLSNTNTDWEEITRNQSGQFFIGDFGNNSNVRKDLCIYKINNHLDSILQKINFQFEDQVAFPPKRRERNFDCEAFFAIGDSLFLFSKNRSKEKVKVYVLDQYGVQQTARVNQTLDLKGMVTGCSYSAATNVCAILTYGEVLFYKLECTNGTIKFRYIDCRKFPGSGQSEAISFVNDSLLAITNEGSRLFYLRLKKNVGGIDDTSKE